jgi:hypothetical protein
LILKVFMKPCSFRDSNEKIIGTAPFKPFNVFIELPKPWPANILSHSFFKDIVQDLVSCTRNFPKGVVHIHGFESCSASTNINFKGIQVYVAGLFTDQLEVFDFSLDSSNPDQEFMELWPRLSDEEWLKNHKSKEDILMICTHQERDACCGRFGGDLVQAYNKRPSWTHRKVYGVTHLGGHRYAPTGLHLNTLRCFGGLSSLADLDFIFDQNMQALFLKYRGHSSLPSGLAQVVEAMGILEFDVRLERVLGFEVQENKVAANYLVKDLGPSLRFFEIIPHKFLGLKDCASQIQEEFVRFELLFS